MVDVCEPKEESESNFKFATTCKMQDREFTISTADKILAKDLAEWIRDGKMIVSSFKTSDDKKDDDNNKLIIEIRRC